MMESKMNGTKNRVATNAEEVHMDHTTFTLHIPSNTLVRAIVDGVNDRLFRLNGDVVVTEAEARGPHEYWYTVGDRPFMVAAQFVTATPE